MPSPQPPAGDPSSAVAVEFLQVYLDDQTTGRTRDLAEYQAMFPGHEAAVAAEFAAVRHDVGGPGSPEDAALPGRAERYQLRGEIGRGGMGRVVRCFDPALGRDVAMKSLATDGVAPSPRRLRRFLHEAKVLARLQHPGIVTVHEIGLDAGGMPYFTMPVVEGFDLQRVAAAMVAGDPRWTLVRAVGVLARVCEAVAHAHARGVVHRDLKPANVMVGTDGATYVVDWGLARMSGDELGASGEPGTADGSPLSGLRDDLLRTADGEVVGTPAYMAPEQARGELDAVGPPSDVYSLGAMLYQLLAGHPPFLGADETRGTKETLARVLDGPPAALPRRGRTLPAELVSICERAMQRDPRRRYASASELAEDLRAFLESRVVRAHAGGWFSTLCKWGRRNALAAGAMLVALVALSGGLVTSVVHAREAGDRMVEAEENFELAIRAGDELLGAIGLHGANVGDGSDPVRRKLLQKANDYFERFVELRGDQPRLRYFVALSHLRLSSLHSELGDVAAARHHAELARDGFADVAARDRGSRVELSRWHTLVARGQILMLDARAGEDVLDELTRVADELLVAARGDQDNGPLISATVPVLGNLGRVLLLRKRGQESLVRIQQRVELSRRLLQLWPDQAVAYLMLGSALSQFGDAMRGTGRPDLAVRALDEAIGVFDDGLERHPGQRSLRFRRFEAVNSLGVARMKLERRAEGEAAFVEAVDGFRALVSTTPPSSTLHGALGGALCNLAIARRGTVDDEAVVALLVDARTALETALQVEPSDQTSRSYLRTLTRELVFAQLRLHDLDAAATAARRLLDRQPVQGRMSVVVALAHCAEAARVAGLDGVLDELGGEVVALVRAAAADGSLRPQLFGLAEMDVFRQRADFAALAERYGK
ncbi:MAG: protein kinase domain-containing protein [Planctomycetota bacterium]